MKIEGFTEMRGFARMYIPSKKNQLNQSNKSTLLIRVLHVLQYMQKFRIGKNEKTI